MMTSVKNVMSYSKSFFCFLEFFLSYLVCLPSFKWINISSLSRTKYKVWWGQFHTHPPSAIMRSKYVGGNRVIWTESSDTVNYKPFFKHCMLQIILHICFFVYICVKQSFILKTELYFILFLICFGVT